MIKIVHQYCLLCFVFVWVVISFVCLFCFVLFHVFSAFVHLSQKQTKVSYMDLRYETTSTMDTFCKQKPEFWKNKKRHRNEKLCTHWKCVLRAFLTLTLWHDSSGWIVIGVCYTHLLICHVNAHNAASLANKFAKSKTVPPTATAKVKDATSLHRLWYHCTTSIISVGKQIATNVTRQMCCKTDFTRS